MCLTLLLLFVGCHDASNADATSVVTVFAAASLIDVIEPLVASFETIHPDVQVVVHTAGSSLLARQLAQGARADVFLSANPDWMQYLVDLGKIQPRFSSDISNKLVAIAKNEDGNAGGLLNQLAYASRIALADPDHVPAGIYARTTLQCMEAWVAVQDKIIPTLDVRAALQALRHGAASMSIVYQSDISRARGDYTITEMPAACQPEIRYAFGIHTTAANVSGASAWIAHIVAPEQADVWEGFGFIYDPSSGL